MEEQNNQYHQNSEMINYQNQEIEIHQRAMVIVEQQNKLSNTEDLNNNKYDKQQQTNQRQRWIQLLLVCPKAILLQLNCDKLARTAATILGADNYIVNQKLFQKQQKAETLQDWERLFGLDDFQEINGQSYTQEDLNCAFKQMNIFWNPNKKKTEQKKRIATKCLQQIERAYKNILKYHNWQ
ncbi:hypothetical protein ABPG74_000883 [Tetrahymena malaccensis]